MKKIFILVCLLFLTGCNATYEITIKDNQIKEKLTLVELDQNKFEQENDTGWTLRQIFESQIEVSKDEFSMEEYTVKDLSTDNKLALEYNSNNSKYSKSLINSPAINQCYTNPIMRIEDDVIKFSTGSDFDCYEYYDTLDEVKIVLKTNHKVISSNAQKIEDDKYIWILTKDGEKNIEFSYEKMDVKESNLITIVGIIILILVVGFVSLYLYRKSKEENKI